MAGAAKHIGTICSEMRFAAGKRKKGPALRGGGIEVR